MKLGSILALGFFVGVSLLAGFIGSFFTMDSVQTWYTTLNRPSWTPPNWVFAPVWTTLYVLMGTAAYLVSRSKKLGKTLVLWLFLAHLLVNMFWSIAFFSLHELLLSVIVIVALLGLIIVLMRLFWRYSHLAAYLMVPYLVWVSYATTLSVGYLFLN
ncbi:MAG: translocator protein [Patescibacteria group bacterium]|jgi:tryptophan-rich sensory protein|nr:translocator protein [Patescibacteria group bacterium]